MGVGVHTGLTMLGVLGEQERVEATVISEAVNAAARIEKLTRALGVQVLVTGATVAALKRPEDFTLRPLGFVRPRGMRDKVALFEVLDAEPPERSFPRKRSAASLAAALEEWNKADFAAAGHIIDEILEADADDGPARFYAKLCRRYMRSGPPQGFEGTVVFR